MEGWGWKFQVSNHGLVLPMTSPHPGAIQEPTQSHFIRTKDTPFITQEITRVSGGLHQEPGIETNIYFLLSHRLQHMYFEGHKKFSTKQGGNTHNYSPWFCNWSYACSWYLQPPSSTTYSVFLPFALSKHLSWLWFFIGWVTWTFIPEGSGPLALLLGLL